MTLLSSVSNSSIKGAMVPIQTITLSSNGGFTFSNIPQTYKHLMLKGTMRSLHNATLDVVLLYPSYVQEHTFLYLMADGSSVTTASLGTNAYGIYCNHIPAATSTAGVFGSFIAWIPDYTSTIKYKGALVRSTSDYNGGGTTTLTVGNRRNTAAITSLGVGGGNNSILAGSSLTLYGIKGVGQ